MSKNLIERAEGWLKSPFDKATQEEVKRLIAHDPKALSDAFFQDLSFGTGGMRGLMGVGTNRLNVYTIRMATQGLANYLKEKAPGSRVFIGYDVRHNSKTFAEETARVFAGNGFLPFVSKDICPTPLVSFACRHFGCAAAIMITASHNPPQYNGYKVYWAGGAQIVPPHDKEIIAHVRTIRGPDEVELADSFEWVGGELDEAYLQALKSQQMLKAKPLKIIYTNLHGTGLRVVPRALLSWGYHDVTVVPEQKALDGNFPNAESPNPEEAKALSLGMEQLKREGADLLLATDPDADRIGVAIADYRFSGNQMACLCLHHVCKTMKEQGKFPMNAAFVKTIVTTELFRAIAESFGGACFDVLTGFKYIGEKIALWEKNKQYRYIFGGEESYGYLLGTNVRDKDAISSACLIAEMAAEAKSHGKTLLDLLEDLYKVHGVYREQLINLSFPDGQSGEEKRSQLMRSCRAAPPKVLAGIPVVSTEDYRNGFKDLPPSDVLRFWLEDKTKVVIRPSGTEPKVKIYIETKDKTVKGCEEKLAKLVADVKKLV